MTRPACEIGGCGDPRAHDLAPFCRGHWDQLPPGLQGGIEEAARLKLPMSKATYTRRALEHINARARAAQERR